MRAATLVLASLVATLTAHPAHAAAAAAADDRRPIVVKTRGRFGLSVLDGALRRAVTDVLGEEGLRDVRFAGPTDGAYLSIDIKAEHGRCGLLRVPLYCLIVRVAPSTPGGRGVTSISAIEYEEPSPAALRTALRKALLPGLAAHALYERRAAAERDLPGDDVPIDVRFVVGDLDAASRSAVANRVVPCVATLAATGTRVMGQRVDDDPVSLTLTLTVRLARAAGSDERWAAAFADRLGGLDHACALGKGPLAGRIVEVRRVARRISVDFARP